MDSIWTFTGGYLFPALATFAQLLPPAAVLPAWRQAPPARRWIAILFLVYFLSDVSQLAIAFTLGPNLWFFTFIEPVEDAILLWALSFWQPRPFTRIAVRAAIPLVAATYIGIGLVAGELGTFRTFSSPFRALLMMAITAFTLVANVQHSPERVWSQDWLWTTLGVLLYFGVLVASEPVLSAIAPTQLQLMREVLSVRAALNVVAFVLVWRGMRCPIPGSSSGST